MASCEIPNCGIKGKKLVKVTSKGYKSIMEASKERGDNIFSLPLPARTVWVHEQCRKNYTSKKAIAATKRREAEKSIPNVSIPSTPTTSKLRSSHSSILKNTCLFCEKEIYPEDYHRGQSRHHHEKRDRISMVTTMNFKDNLLAECLKRNDEHSRRLYRRVASVFDLVAADAVYHRKCYLSFKVKRPRRKLNVGRPSSETVTHAMDQIFHLLESSEDCQFSLSSLMNEIEGERPTVATVISKLREKYGDNIYISRKWSKEVTVCFRDPGNRILNEHFYENRLTDPQEERLRIVKAAAEIILQDISLQVHDLSTYPPCSQFFSGADEQLPTSLKVLLESIICRKKVNPEKHKKKCCAIGHCIVAASRPRTFNSSVQLGTSVYFQRTLGSKKAVDILHKLGFCASYNETRKFQLSAVSQHEDRILDGTFCQFVFDNADFNAATLDGLNTLHIMGGIRSITPSSGALPSKRIKRLHTLPTVTEISGEHNMAIQYYNKPASAGLKMIQFIDVDEKMYYTSRENENLFHEDVMWLCGKVWGVKIGGWNGFMMKIHQDEPYFTSSVSYLPFVNLPASDYNCILSVIWLAQNKTRELSQKIAIVTFDQPLFLKAMDITLALSLFDVVIRLGGFHLLMSFLGCIGFLMAGSGLKEILSLIYAPNTIDKMLAGHAYARAMRAHFLVHEALGRILLTMVDIITDNEKQRILEFFTDTSLNINNINEDDTIRCISEKLQVTMSDIFNAGPTARLWLQYFQMVTLVKHYIKAERSGNWRLHLHCVRNMIPYFHAAGHFPYAKSAHLYLQSMVSLSEKMPSNEFENFTTRGFFTIRQTSKFWSGLASDQIIETTLMKNLKSVGGITRGRSTTESVKTQWILGAAIGAEMTQQLENFCELETSGGEQHVDWREARQIRDAADVKQLMEWFENHRPFEKRENIVSLATGIVGNPQKIQCYKAYEVGDILMREVAGKKYTDVMLKRSKTVAPLAMLTSSIQVGPKKQEMPIDPLGIFQRLCILPLSKAMLRSYISNFELAPFPLTLFDSSGMRKTTKSDLYALFEPCDEPLSRDYEYIIDGGFLIHRVVWSKGKTFNEISEMYLQYVERHFGMHCHIVFDGYKKQGLKTAEHSRRYQSQAPDVIINEDATVTVSQDLFLANTVNKSRFITLLCSKYNEHNIRTSVADGDADLLIVTTAVEAAHKKERQTVLVGEDIDLLVIAITVCDPNEPLLFMKPGKGNKKTIIYNIAHLAMDNNLKSGIMFTHTFTGCDSTSAIFNKGKIRFSKLLLQLPELEREQILQNFTSSHVSKESILQSACKAFLCMFGAPKEEESVNLFRYNSFERAASRQTVDLRSLCPTEEAVRQHAYRVYLQIQMWLGNELSMTDWGWKKADKNVLIPIGTTAPSAPATLLKKIFCSCKKGCGGGCGCRKLGLKCTSTCLTCRGTSCMNSLIEDPDEEIEIEEL